MHDKTSNMNNPYVYVENEGAPKIMKTIFIYLHNKTQLKITIKFRDPYFYVNILNHQIK